MLWNFDMRGEYKYIVLYEIIRNFMLNVDSKGNCISLVFKWHYYVGIESNGNRNIIKWIVISVHKLCWDLYA